ASSAPVWARRSPRMSTRNRAAPCLPRASATARPRPRAAPVIRATGCFGSVMGLSPCIGIIEPSQGGAAIDGDVLAGDEGGLVRGQKGKQVARLLRGAGAPQADDVPQLVHQGAQALLDRRRQGRQVVVPV